MTDSFSPIPLPRLLNLTLQEIRQNRFLGISGSLFFKPDKNDPFRMMRYHTELETPVGVAAGPHTQLAPNIIAAWLCGARYIELKTIQTLDELVVSKPCIDMQDEGYNCEWSQELKIEQSFQEYLNAWIIIHILRNEMGFEGPLGTLFNMSVGYNMDGILQENVQWFFDKMSDCTAELNLARASIRKIYPQIDQLSIPSCISNHITLSTMHGCPVEEIGKIGLYLIRERNLHTTIKLNPTLLGPEELRGILNTDLGFKTHVPDIAFEHDVKFPDAIQIINELSEASAQQHLQFSIKLTNTLESLNHKTVFGKQEEMMYMSGRALHPISIKVAQKLQHYYQGNLDISFSAGIDCFNIAPVLACGLRPLTVCSDLLKPGGYGRLWQYIDNLRKDFADKQASNLQEFIVKSAGNPEFTEKQAALQNLNNYADNITKNKAYQHSSFNEPGIKTERTLEAFDCIHAPCIDTCPTHQDIPAYMREVAKGRPDVAMEIVYRTNPFPSVTGMVCDHLCQFKCTRINYDESVQIREIKRYIAENAGKKPEPTSFGDNGLKAAIIGAGPAGLSCAWFLRQGGMDVDIYEQKTIAGGMVSAAIPSFRLTNEAIERDINHILSSGVKLHDGFTINEENFDNIRQQHQVVFLATGAQDSMKLNLEGMDAKGILDPLQFLFSVKENKHTDIGNNVVIVGGGNTAMDAARTAYRLVGKDGQVTILYRRTRVEMPADKGEIQAVLEEGINIIELANPERIVKKNGRITAMVCSKNVLTSFGKDGRPTPIKIPDSEFEIQCDTLIPAVGQAFDFSFVEKELLTTEPGHYKTKLEGIYIGGDALRGAATAIKAIADGRLAAEEIMKDLHITPQPAKVHPETNIISEDLIHQKSIRKYPVKPAETEVHDRQNFNLVISSLEKDAAKKEAARCLSCDQICNVCVSVCPNLANYSYKITPVTYHLQNAMIQENGEITFAEAGDFIVNQEHQVLNLRDLCNECGNCTTFCPTNGKPFSDKPGLCLSVQTLNKEGKGFYLSHLPDRKVLIYKSKEQVKTLTLIDNEYIYETDQVSAIIEKQTFRLKNVTFLTPCVKEFHFGFAAEMSIIMQGAMQLSI